ncbi:MAG: hypothetical protein PHI86_07265 [Candidatus Omnitrophica bacterium]|nr:hypothetical protein [Candidatus Omnitrophota bacterium]
MNMTAGDVILNMTFIDYGGKDYISHAVQTIYDQSGKLLYSATLELSDYSSNEKINITVLPLELFDYGVLYSLNTTVYSTNPVSPNSAHSRQITMHFEKIYFSASYINDVMVGQATSINGLMLAYEDELDYGNSFVQLKVMGSASNCINDDSLFCESVKNPDNSGAYSFDCTVTTPGTYKLCLIANSTDVEHIYSNTLNVHTTSFEMPTISRNLGLGSSGKRAYEFKLINPTDTYQTYMLWISSVGIYSRFSLNAEQEINVTLYPNQVYYGQIDIFPSIIGTYTNNLKFKNINYPLDNNTAGITYSATVLSVMGGDLFSYVVTPDFDYLSLAILFIIAVLVYMKIK